MDFGFLDFGGFGWILIDFQWILVDFGWSLVESDGFWVHIGGSLDFCGFSLVLRFSMEF